MIRVLALWVVCCGVSNAYVDYQNGPEPPWVEAFGFEQNDAKPEPGQTTRYLLVDEQRRVTDNNTQWFYHYAFQPLNQVGVSENSEIFISYNPEYQRVVLHKLDVIRDDEVSSRLESSEIRDVGGESDVSKSIYTGERRISIIVDDVRIGDVVEYSYSLEGGNPVFENRVFGTSSVGWTKPVDSQVLRLLVPNDREIQYRAHGVELPPKISARDNSIEYLWQQKKVPAYESEDYQAPWYLHYPFVEYSEFKSWQQVNQWASELFAKSQGWELPTKLREQIAKAASDEDKVRLLLRFVQDDIRYISLSIGESSHRPHQPSMVLKNRYGDCKDKSRLLVEMLRELGIDANVALVSTSITSAVKALLPSPGLFNHAIVTANVDGQDIWLDPTSSYQRGSFENMGFPNYGAALVVTGKGGVLTDMVPLKGQQDTVSLEERFSANDYSGTVDLEVASRYCGAFADYYRYEAAVKTSREMQNNFLNYMSAYYPSVSVADKLKIVDEEDENCITYIESYSIDDFWEKSDKKLTGYFYTLAMKDYLRKPSVRFRETPFYVGRAKTLNHKMHFKFPSDIGLDLSPESTHYKAKGISYKTRWKYDKQVMTAESQLKTDAVEVKPGELKDYLKQVSKIEEDLAYSVFFPDPDKVSNKRSKLLDLLRELGQPSESGS